MYSTMHPNDAADILRYLHGHKVDHIGNDGKKTRAAVIAFLHDRLQTALDKYKQRTEEANRKRTHSNINPLYSFTLGDTGVFFQNYEHSETLPEFPNAEGGLDGNPDKRCRAWITEFYSAQSSIALSEGGFPSKRIHISSSLSETSTPSPISRCLLLSSQFELEKHLDILLASEGDALIHALPDFSERLYDVMIRWLETLSGIPVKNLNQPEEPTLLTKEQAFAGWQDAWATDYRGNALRYLESKLTQLSLDTRSQYQSVSRLIPVVQASGAGKSRYATTHFAVNLGLRNGNSFPPPDKYVSEYFHSVIAQTFQHLIVAERTEKINAYTKFNPPQSMQYEPTYTKEWRMNHANGDSVPYPWAAVARLRVACFLASFFNTVLHFLKQADYQRVDTWQTRFKHHGPLSASNGERERFWKRVVSGALDLLYDLDGRNYQSEWLKPGEKSEVLAPKNHQIAEVLERILSDPIRKFLSSGWCRRLQSDQDSLPFCLIVDEAAYLHTSLYMKAWMWVLDQVVVSILDKTPTESGGEDPADHIFFLMLGTHSQITHFAPDEHFPSERYFERTQALPSVFLNFAWDSSYQLPAKNTYDASNSLQHLIQYGRPLWLSYIDGLTRLAQRLSKTFERGLLERYLREACIGFAVMKLAPLASGNQISESEKANSAFATMAVRLHLDIDLGNPKRASELVASKMRWLVNVSEMRSRIRTTYLSEPILAEAAACIMNGFLWKRPQEPPFPDRDHGSPMTYFIEKLGSELNHSYVDRGSNGELTARLLCIIAKDTAVLSKWSDRDPFDIPRKFYDSFRAGDNNSSLLFHTAVPVKDFLRSLFAEPVYNEIETHFMESTKWSSLDRAYVNFSHWSLVKAPPDDISYTKTGFLALWHRHVAVICKAYFPNIYLIIPMAYQDGEMSYILISVKNKTSGNENLKDPFMSTSNVEGKPSGESSTKDNHYLGLSRLRFVSGTASCWVKHTQAKPIVAMVLSMGDVERTEKLVVPEEPSSKNADRIVFAIRGFKATYRFPTLRIENAMTDIVVRHDVSGDFPESRPTNAVERQLFEQVQELDGDFHGLIDRTAVLLQDMNKSSQKRKPPSDDDEDPDSRIGDSNQETSSKAKSRSRKRRTKK